jgi:uncharacterized protein YebE (UPF0316 family)
MTSQAILTALFIFFLRVLNVGIGTVRLVIVTRQQRVLASVLGFFEALIFAVTMASVVTDLTNVVNLLAYCGGFSVGSYLGMIFESRFITSFMAVNVITHEHGHEIALALREAGYGVTETVGEGRDGTVTMIHSIVLNKDVPKLLHIVRATHPEAFCAVEQARTVQRGHIRASREIR